MFHICCNCLEMIRLTYSFLSILIIVSSFNTIKSDTVNSVNIIRKLIEDLQLPPSGYTFHRSSDSIHPGGYGVDVNHGEKKSAGQIKLGKSTNINNRPNTYTASRTHDTTRIQRAAGGYGFVISHDYGTGENNAEAPSDDVHYGRSKADLQSITVFKMNNVNFGNPIIDVEEQSKPILYSEKSKDPDGNIEKEKYGSYMEYDKLVKGRKNVPTDNPEEYYGSEVYGKKEKYDSDDGYTTSNNNADKESYVESGKYDGYDDNNENENYSSLNEQSGYIDDDEVEKYIVPEEYIGLGEFIDREKSNFYDEYGKNQNDEKSEPFKLSDYGNENFKAASTYDGTADYNVEPKFDYMKNFLSNDFFKEYNQFAHGNNQLHEHDKDHEYYDDCYNIHDYDDANNFYNEGGDNEKGFFDYANSEGENNEEGAGGENGHFGEKSGHKKGSKTTGYHNVFNKDKYTKDHTFYEDGKKNGYFDKDGNYDEHNFEHDGSYEKASHHDSSSDDHHRGETDSEDKGYNFDDDLSHHDEHDDKSYFDDNYDYSSGKDSQYDSKYEESYDSNFDPDH